MPQIFHPSTNTLSKASIFGAVFVLAAIAWGLGIYVRSPYATGAQIIQEQPVPFSHERHVAGNGIDCRFCHASVEVSSSAGMPSTETCMSCHAQIFADAPILEPVRQSLATGQPLAWKRVHDLPDFVYFDHSAHVQNGIGCSTCHGAVHEMPLMRKVHSLHMEWCLGCHGDPVPYLRPPEEVFNMDWRPPPNQRAVGQRLLEAYDVRVEQLRDCWICHR